MHLLDDLKTIQRLDPAGMMDRAGALAQQCRDGWAMGLGWRVPVSLARCRSILILGMGGSAIGADLLEGILRDKLTRPIVANRTYTLPAWVGKQTLVVACSYSGNTEETLSAARQARQRGAKLVAITSGGKLAAWAKRTPFPLLTIPQGLPPRGALGYLAFAPLGLVARLGWVSRRSLGVEGAIRSLKRYITTTLAPSVHTRSNPAKRAAAALKGKLPILYGAAAGWEGVTYRWKTQLEENAKTLAFHHIFPEATHNEISGWVHPKGLMRQLIAVFLKDSAIHPRTQMRMKFTSQIVRRQGTKVLWLDVAGSSYLSRLLRLISLGDFISVYLALLYREDPTPVVRVEALKKYMRKGS